MTFYEIEFPLASLNCDAVEAALLEVGASSITFVDRGDEPVLEPKPGEMRLWSDTLVRALFQESSDAAVNLDRLAATLGAHVTHTARVRAVADREAIIVRLDPGLAFGTGTHPTTALCLQILDSLPLAGRTLIDYGCGSGILGIAALKLGAASVTAVDLDHQALLATRDNAVRNGVSSQMTVQGVEDDLHAAYCVVANILAGPLIELAPKLTAACETGGYLLLSGLLKTQAYEVKAAYAVGFDMVQVVERDEWCCIYARRVP